MDKIKKKMERHPIVVLVAYGKHEVLEGDPIEGMVIARFPDVNAAKAWCFSDASESLNTEKRDLFTKAF